MGTSASSGSWCRCVADVLTRQVPHPDGAVIAHRRAGRNIDNQCMKNGSVSVVVWSVCDASLAMLRVLGLQGLSMLSLSAVSCLVCRDNSVISVIEY